MLHCSVLGCREKAAVVHVSPVLRLSLSKIRNELLQGLRDRVLGQVRREGESKAKARQGFDTGEHHIGPVGHVPPAVNEKALNTTALQLVTSGGIVA